MSKGINQEGSFVTKFTKITDTLILCALWMICCIPLVTVGVSSCALYFAYHKAVRQDMGHPCRTFFRAFLSDFWQATGVWLLLILFSAMSLFACYILWAMRTVYPFAGALLVMGMLVMGFVMAWSLCLFPYMARFRNTLGQTLKNSAVITIAHILWSILLMILLLAAVILTLFKPVMCVVAVALYVWLSNLILERIFRKVMTEEERVSEMEADNF